MRVWVCSMLLVVAVLFTPVFAAQVQVLLPLNRVAYQTNEMIDISVMRTDVQALPAAELVLTLSSIDGSRLSFTFPVKAVPVVGNEARTTEHLRLNGWLMRPGNYRIEADVQGATGQAAIEIYSHIRQSTYALIDWATRADPKKPGEQARLGEDGMGFNQIWPMSDVNPDEAIRAGVDYMRACIIGGGHQVDLRIERDWSDPYVLRGAFARVARRALEDRTRPNALGIHFFDEPGLTWTNGSPHQVPAQYRSYAAAFGATLTPVTELAGDAEKIAAWKHFANWKLAFMDAAWKYGKHEVDAVDPRLLSVTQSQYAFGGFTDGYSFRITRSLPVTSGHGGYDGWTLGYYNPSYHLEMARARELDKPTWYLPTWYANIPSERYRLEQYLSFMTGIHGMAKSPNIQVHQGNKSPQADSVLETNRTMGALGTIFTTMPATRPPVALLLSYSQMMEEQVTTAGKVINNYGSAHGKSLNFVYLAGKMIQQPFQPVVDEDVIDGTLAANYRAIILANISYLHPAVIRALESFSGNGGLVLMKADSTVTIAGAVKLEGKTGFSNQVEIDRLAAERKFVEMQALTHVGKQYEVTLPLAREIQQRLEAAGIKPVFACDNYGIAAYRHAQGDVEYLFAVNASFDNATDIWNAIAPADATIGVAADDRPIYDAVRGGEISAAFPQQVGGMRQGAFRFGAGAMRVFARTSRPIGGVQVLPPTIVRDFTRSENPLTVTIRAVVRDTTNVVLAGAFPMRIKVIDSLGTTRYDLYRATDDGMLTLTLPLAANDADGSWKVEVRELLNHSTGVATFTYRTSQQCGTLAGAQPRAVLFGNDRDHLFAFFRNHQDITVVIGAGEYTRPAAQRLAESLAPWGIRCTIVDAAAVNKPRQIPEEAVAVWTPLDKGSKLAVDNYGVGQTGFAIDGAAILIGTPEDNPLIKFAQDRFFLPYKAAASTFPGAGRGYLAWQRGSVGYGQESVSLIAYDAAGMAEAVGTCYEIAAGLDPNTPLDLPLANLVTQANTAAVPAMAALAWQTVVSDSPRSMTVNDAGDILVVTRDRSVITLDAGGKEKARRLATAAETAVALGAVVLPQQFTAMLLPDKLVKASVKNDTMTAIAYWGGTLQIVDSATLEVKAQQRLPQDISALVWHGNRLVVGLADGRILALELRG